MVNVRTISGTVNTDQKSAATPPDLGGRGGAKVGHKPPHLGGLGASPQQTTRTRPNHSDFDPRRSHGGQAGGPAFFGLRLTGDTGSAPKAAAVRPVPRTPQPRPIGDDRPRRIEGLSFGQRRAIVCRPSPAEVERRNAAMCTAAIASELRQDRDWHEHAELLESHPTLPYGSVETACALND